MSDAPPGDFSGSVHPTGHPLVARFTGTIPADSQVVVEFGLTTKYGRSTAPVAAPEGGGEVSFLVGGMKAASTYRLRARIRTWDGKWWTSPDAALQDGPIAAVDRAPDASGVHDVGRDPEPRRRAREHHRPARHLGRRRTSTGTSSGTTTTPPTRAGSGTRSRSSR